MYYNADANPLRTPLVILLVALSVSIGWGIRGNFGHEAGAMIPGALGAIAIACCSRRADWQARIPHAALLGGLGFGFGGSISYMYPISFTMSGHFPTMYYGFLTVFLEGGLWCALGTMGAALALTSDRNKLAPMYKPLIWVLVAMWIHNLFHDRIDVWLQPEARVVEDATWNRQENPLYWFDADWASAMAALIGVCLYQLVGQRWQRNLLLPLFVLFAAFAGWGVQRGLDSAGQLDAVTGFFVVPQGDLSAINPDTGEPLFNPENLMTNWPLFFSDHPGHVGWLVGAFVGFLSYFLIFGKRRNGSGLFLYMSLGWLIAFLAMPVFGSIFMMEYGGFRAMPPRSDDWAGIVGVFVGACLWTWRNDQKAATLAGTLGFLLGGLGFTTAQLLRCIAVWPGNPYRNPGEDVGPFLKHYQSTNWHSVLEQTQGFCLGLALVIALGTVWRVHAPRNSDQTMPKWTSAFSAWFTLFVITFFNIFKNVERWIDSELIPGELTAPLISFLEFNAATWFNLTWWAAALAGAFVFYTHTQRRLPMLSGPPAGRGQVLYLCILWLMVVMNFARALPFSEGRVITEWSVTINACLATALLLTLRTEPYDPITLKANPLPRLRRLWTGGLSGAVALMFVYAVIIKALYGGGSVMNLDHAHRRFGPDAIWRTKPIMKNEEHR
jgi:hypothetical protein